MFCFRCSWLIYTFENPIGLGSGRALFFFYNKKFKNGTF